LSQYGVIWTPAATRALAALPENVATAAIEFIYTSMAQSPARIGKPLRFELEGLHSARRGDYRIIYAVDVEIETLTIMAIQHRADVYRRC